MNDAVRILIIIFFAIFFLRPVLTGLTNFSKVYSLKKFAENSGSNYFKVKKDTDKTKKTFPKILNISLVVFSLFLLIFGQWFIALLTFCASLLFISLEMLRNKTNVISGIYENGIIDDNKGLVEWKDIYSYEINGNDISGYFNDGLFFQYKNLENINEISDLFERKKIMKR